MISFCSLIGAVFWDTSSSEETISDTRSLSKFSGITGRYTVRTVLVSIIHWSLTVHQW